MAKTKENTTNIFLIVLSFQKIRASKNGIPVCPEKNKSPPNVSLLNILEVSGICDGKGPIWVRVIKIDLMTINKAILLMVNGVRCGLTIQTKNMKKKKATEP